MPGELRPERTSHHPSHLRSQAPPKWRVRQRGRAERRRRACKAAVALSVRSPAGPCRREHALFHSRNRVPQRGQRRLRLRGEERPEPGRAGAGITGRSPLRAASEAWPPLLGPGPRTLTPDGLAGSLYPVSDSSKGRSSSRRSFVRPRRLPLAGPRPLWWASLASWGGRLRQEHPSCPQAGPSALGAGPGENRVINPRTISVRYSGGACARRLLARVFKGVAQTATLKCPPAFVSSGL